jgi:hypothetical protein
LAVWAATIPLWWNAFVVTMANGQWSGGATRTLGVVLKPYVLTLIVANFALIVVTIVVRFPHVFVM